MIRISILSTLLLASLVTGALTTSRDGSQAGGSLQTVRIIYTSDTVGYLEPCGCGGRYEGGLSRRATIVGHLLEENRNTLVLDSGNVTNQATNCGTILEIMSEMGYEAVGVGQSELALGSHFFEGARRKGIAVVSALAVTGRPVVPYLVKRLDDVNVGVVSYGADSASVVGSLDASRRAFYTAYKAARDSSDILVLLDQGGIATDDWLGFIERRFGGPDVVIAGVANESLTQEKTVGRTHIMPTSIQGRQLGVIDIAVADAKPQSISVRMIKVDKDTPEDEAVKKQIDDYIKGLAMRIINGDQPTDSDTTKTSSLTQKRGYLSPETCASCHADEYEDWRKTDHASAVKTLVNKSRLIPECAGCHSEEFRQTKIITGRSDEKMPAGVDCASCHASVLPHGEDGPSDTSKRKVDVKLCVSCHNSERSPDYNEKTYLPRVSHSTAVK